MFPPRDYLGHLACPTNLPTLVRLADLPARDTRQAKKRALAVAVPLVATAVLNFLAASQRMALFSTSSR
ncbi:MAG TPA: hypothetical protein VKB77_02345 [Terriglobales bacterium]|nr:hypothetical protein [Terriglobales bacterium]